MPLIYSLIISLSFSCASTKVQSQTNAPFNGKKFDNIESFPDKNIFSLLWWKIRGLSNSVDWPEDIKSTQFKPLKERSLEPIITVINHATILIQMNGINILTDPHFSGRASPVQFAGPKRAVEPGIKFELMPKIDYILISHNHYDHLDLDTLKRFAKRDNPLILAGLKTQKFLKENDLDNAKDMDWWSNFIVDKLTITFVPAQHWSARGLFDKREMLWGGFYIKGIKSIYFAGDTGYGKFFKLIKDKLGPPEVALLPIGAYEPRWFMKSAHMNPKEAVQAFIDLESRRMFGMHFGTFKLTDEGYKDPVIDLQQNIKKRNLNASIFTVPIFGQAYKL